MTIKMLTHRRHHDPVICLLNFTLILLATDKAPSGVVFEPVEVLTPIHGWVSYHDGNPSEIYHVYGWL